MDMETRFIRFGNIPEGGKSYNHMNESFEDGVSCYRVARVGGKWLIDGAYGSYRQMFFSDRPMLEVGGREIGTGSDGEPILADAVVVRKMRRESVPLNDCWEKVFETGPTRPLYRHLVTGAFWCCLFSSGDFKCTNASELERLVTLYGKSDSLLSRVREAL
jgi:hypothetical protein